MSKIVTCILAILNVEDTNNDIIDINCKITMPPYELTVYENFDFSKPLGKVKKIYQEDDKLLCDVELSKENLIDCDLSEYVFRPSFVINKGYKNMKVNVYDDITLHSVGFIDKSQDVYDEKDVNDA